MQIPVQEKSVLKLPPHNLVETEIAELDGKFEYLLLLSPYGFVREKIIQSIKRRIKADNDYPPHFILSPHLTLCKRLSIEQYEKSLLEYKGQYFSDEFTANEMLLLKRPVTEPGNYKEVGWFEFGGPEMCDTTTQLKLF